MDDQHECLVMMKKPVKWDRFMCNEERFGVVDRNWAKFRCNRVVVVAMFDLVDKLKVYSIYHWNENIGIVTNYRVGEFVDPDSFDMDLDKVCASGIHYFLTPEAAKSYSFVNGCCCTDDDKEYDKNGQIFIFLWKKASKIIPPINPSIIRSKQKQLKFGPCNNNIPKYNCFPLAKSKVVKICKSLPLIRTITQPLIRQPRQRYRGCVKS
jgi:hypothetical protein